MANKSAAPKFLNLFRIHFPVGAVTSIAHRLSGAILFLSFPFMVFLLDLSLRGPAEYQQAITWLEPYYIRLLTALVVWALCHHLLAGIRFLIIDLGIGVGLKQARASAWLVNLLGLVFLMMYLGWAL